MRNDRGKMDLRLIAGNLSANKGYHLQYPTLEKVLLHCYELDKNNPECEGSCKERGDQASVDGEKSKSRNLRVAPQLVNQHLGF